jgi:hypothetical protein
VWSISEAVMGKSHLRSGWAVWSSVGSRINSAPPTTLDIDVNYVSKILPCDRAWVCVKWGVWFPRLFPFTSLVLSTLNQVLWLGFQRKLWWFRFRSLWRKGSFMPGQVWDVCVVIHLGRTWPAVSNKQTCYLSCAFWMWLMGTGQAAWTCFGVCALLSEGPLGEKSYLSILTLCGFCLSCWLRKLSKENTSFKIFVAKHGATCL